MIDNLPRKPDGEIILKEMSTTQTGKVFEDVLDEMHSQDGGDASAELHTSEREQLEREEVKFLSTLSVEASRLLAPQGLRAKKAYLDRTDGETYVVEFADSENRRHEVRITVEKAYEFFMGSEQGGQLLINHVCEEALASRARYFARMQ